MTEKTEITCFFYDDLNLMPPENPQFSLSDQPVLELSAQQVLIQQGEYSHSIFWLLEGLIRAVYTNASGKEYTKEFFWDGDVIFQPRSLLTTEPLPYSLVALERCCYQRLSVQQYWALVDTELQWQRYHQRLLTTHLINKERKEEFLLLHSPRQRVELFNQYFPWLIKRVPDYILATYLGITPISYSRIKKRLNLSY